MECLLDDLNGYLVVEVLMTPFEIGLLLQGHPRAIHTYKNGELIHIKVRMYEQYTDKGYKKQKQKECKSKSRKVLENT